MSADGPDYDAMIARARRTRPALPAVKAPERVGTFDLYLVTEAYGCVWAVDETDPANPVLTMFPLLADGSVDWDNDCDARDMSFENTRFYDASSAEQRFWVSQMIAALRGIANGPVRDLGIGRDG